MELEYQEEALCGKYDERNLTISGSGKRKYPSKKMFIEFLKTYKDVDGNAEIWSTQNLSDGEVTINVQLTYKVNDVLHAADDGGSK